MHEQQIARLENLVDPQSQWLVGMTPEEAGERLLRHDATAVLQIHGSFALVAREGERVRLARSLDRPLRYFMAKVVDGPMLVVAERIDEIQRFLETEGLADQFHPSYTRMVPAHHVTTLRLVGCPDPNPVHERFLELPSEPLPADLDVIGERYVEALRQELAGWLDTVPDREPLGVLFSGGLDSGAILLCLYHLLLERGESPARLKAFTLAVDGGGDDAAQAREFLRRLDLELFGETVDAASEEVDTLAAVEVIEDYKPLDVECAAVNLALLAGIRRRYPEWRFLVDGDGGDENFKDYPIEENPELTIRSVVNNPLLYQEGWGVDCLKHSLVYSGGLSRGCVRGHAPARRHGFLKFSPHAQPAALVVATAVPFTELARGSHEVLYGLKGEILQRGVRQVTGLEMPVFPKRRFQYGAVPEDVARHRFAVDPEVYRGHFMSLYRTAGR